MDAERAQQEALLHQKFVDSMWMRIGEGVGEKFQLIGAIREKSVVTGVGTLPLHDLVRHQQFKNIKKHLTSRNSNVDCTDTDSGLTPLMTACYHGYLKVVKLLVSLGANVNFRCSGLNGFGLKYSNVTPIYIAAEEGHGEIIRYLVEKGADVNVRCSPLGYTPLHRAVCCRHEDIVFSLVNDYKAIVNIPNADGEDPILTAVKWRAHEILDTLVSAKGVDCSIPDANEKMTALHHAAYHGDLTSVELLHTKGKANLNAQIVGGFTPLDLAIQQKHRAVIDYLKNVGAVQNVGKEKWLPFQECAAGGLIPLKTAISRGVSANCTIIKGSSALHYNVLKLNSAACKYLLKNGAKVDHRDHYGNTPMHFAAQTGRTDFIKLLLDYGADVNVTNGAGNTPLHATAKKGLYSAASMLLNHGADPNIHEYEGGSPIFSAAAMGHSNIVKLLLSKGVDANSKARIDTIDNTPVLMIACMHSGNRPDLIKALVNGGADVNARITSPRGEVSALHVIPYQVDGYEETLKIMIEAGAYIDTELKAYNTITIGNIVETLEITGTPLMVLESSNNKRAISLLSDTLELFRAVRKNNLRQAKEYIARGGLVNCCSVKFETPLIYASWKGYHDMVKLLLQHGASMTMQSVKKSTPLHYAAKSNHKSVVIELLRAGAKYDAVCCNKTAVQVAEENNHKDIVNLLKFVGEWLTSLKTTTICSTKNISDEPNYKQLLAQVKDNVVLKKDLSELFGETK